MKEEREREIMLLCEKDKGSGDLLKRKRMDSCKEKGIEVFC